MPELPARRPDGGLLVRAAACAVVAIAISRMGALSPLNLVPLGFAALAFGASAAWLAVAFHAAGSLILTLALMAREEVPAAVAGADLLNSAVTALGFVWVMAGNPRFLDGRLPQPRTLFRLAAASVAGALSLLALLFADGARLLSEMAAAVEWILASLAEGNGADAALLGQMLAAGSLEGMLASTVVGGVALLSAAVVLFVSRQAAFMVARLARRIEGGSGDLIGFFAPRRTAVVFAASILAALAGGSLAIPALALAASNAALACALVFAAQGMGIALAALRHRRASALARALFGVLLAVALLTPLGIVVIGALLAVGIAETWVPMRKKWWNAD